MFQHPVHRLIFSSLHGVDENIEFTGQEAEFSSGVHRWTRSVRRDPRSKVGASRAASRDEGDRLNSSRTKVRFLREESEEKQEQDWRRQCSKTRRVGAYGAIINVKIFFFQRLSDANSGARTLEQRGRPRRPGLDFRKITRQRVQTRRQWLRHRLEKLADVKRPRCLGNSELNLGQAWLSSPDRLLAHAKSGGGLAGPAFFSGKRATYPPLLAIWILLDSGFLTGLGRFDGVNFSRDSNNTSANINATLLLNLARTEMLVPTDSLSRPCSLSSVFFHPVVRYAHIKPSQPAEDPRNSNVVLQPSAQPSVNFAADVDLDLTDPGFTDALGRVGDEFRKLITWASLWIFLTSH
ncbi:hypothetical protein BDZ89DRAFT_1049850 [Hymenopellis radicata]|nr:hypothetical protein BDZ89DRAFT_1049850 [Hymenopellis radicata]